MLEFIGPGVKQGRVRAVSL